MTFQTRAGALDALESVMAAALASPVTFERDPEKNVPASHDGVVIMRHGDPGDPEVILSPLSFAFEHQVEFEITASGPDRATTVESIIGRIDPALAVDRTLGGAVDDARVMTAPDINEYEADGVETERSAVLHVQLSYTTASAAG
ncbi:MAG TPA: hypothetical protein VGM17_02280 [Rhizomicrobium sp.]|jgi:hypothetical protein